MLLLQPGVCKGFQCASKRFKCQFQSNVCRPRARQPAAAASLDNVSQAYSLDCIDIKAPATTVHCNQLQLCITRRVAFAATLAAASQWFIAQEANAISRPYVDPELLKAFQEALTAQSYEAMEAAWTRAIAISPDNAAAWSNRGTVRLQHGQWQAACDDLSKALQLELQQTGSPNALLLNNLGNAEGALGRWDDAMQHYQQASDDAEVGSIALANYALAAFETQKNDLAINSARRLLRRDPEFMDMRCALTAFLWASGQRSQAEDSWSSSSRLLMA